MRRRFRGACGWVRWEVSERGRANTHTHSLSSVPGLVAGARCAQTLVTRLLHLTHSSPPYRTHTTSQTHTSCHTLTPDTPDSICVTVWATVPNFRDFFPWLFAKVVVFFIVVAFARESWKYPLPLTAETFVWLFPSLSSFLLVSLLSCLPVWAYLLFGAPIPRLLATGAPFRHTSCSER